MAPLQEEPLRGSWLMFAVIAGFSILTVYCTFGSIHTMDVGTGAVAATESLEHYRQALRGIREFPYQWRLLGIYLVYVTEHLSGFDPHAIDVVIKAILLCVSSSILFVFSLRYTSAIGALCAVAFYCVLTVAGFTDQYSIYFTNDYAMIALWFAAVLAVRQRAYAVAAALTFVGAFAKETMLLVPVLIGLRFLRKQATFGQVALAGLAFAIPTVMLRWTYRAPLGKWAWWDMVFANVPFLQSSFAAFVTTLKNNVKVALFFNVLWLVAARAVVRSSDTFIKDLAVTSVVYLFLAYPVIYIRELRHFLPLAILILPVAIAELERQSRGIQSRPPAPRR
jgi:hypothetical protein